MKFFAKSSGKSGELYIYDAIGPEIYGDGVSAKSVAESLADMGGVKSLDIFINSPGGSVFEGIAIFNQLKRFAARKIVHVDAIAASIASVVAMAGDEIQISSNAHFMVHNPFGIAVGTAEKMRSYADALDKLRDVMLNTYASRTGADLKQIGAWMDAETWMNAEESVSRGFADKVTEGQAIKAEFPLLDKFCNVPPALRQQALVPSSLVARMNMRVQRLSLGASPKNP